MDELIREEVGLLRNLNFAEDYIKGCYENCNKWKVTGLLKGITDPYIARQVSELLENQRLWNENYAGSEQWKRCSIPVVRRVFNQDFLGFKLVSIQAARKPEDFVYYTNEEMRVRSSLSSVKTRFLPLLWQKSESDGFSYNLDREAELVAVFSEEYAKEISKEIITDLLSICDNKQYDYQGEDHLFSLVEGMSAYIGTKTPYEATWIVANPKVCEVLRPKLDDRWNLYEFDVPVEKILLGYKNPKNHYISGYIYSPYLPFSLSENGILVRYNKKLINASYYGSITLNNFEQETLSYEEENGSEV